MKRYLLLLSTLVLLFSCEKKQSLVHYVDPFIGTDAHGHTFPGATTPYGMVQLSPSNDFKTWDWCSGYHYSDSIIKGFAHNHISGAGLSGLGDILIMPTMGKETTYAGSDEEVDTSYRSRFSHDSEKAYAGYYEVLLEDYNIKVALTATTRSGFHKYTFLKAGEAAIVLDPTHTLLQVPAETGIEKVSDTEVRGFKKMNMGEHRMRSVYFSAKFSKPFKKITLTENDEPIQGTENTSKRTNALVYFDVDMDEDIEIVVTLSPTDYEGVAKNYEVDSNMDFDAALKSAESSWDAILNKIVLGENTTEADKRTFYTALYHTAISPNIISDVDGNYTVEGEKQHSDFTQFSNYSTWDTYRALHPLMTIINPTKTSEIVNSMISRTTEAGVGQPVWELGGFDNYCMIGYTTAPIIAEAVLKDIDGVDTEAAFETIRSAAFDITKHSAVYDVSGLADYINYGYVTGETGSSVSKTTEYNYHDYAIAQVAQKLGKTEDAALFTQRSLGYRSLYDPKTGYLMPKLSTGDMNYMDTSVWDGMITNYVSGNIWAYSAYTPQDMAGSIALHGGKEKYAAWLDGIFTDTTQVGGAQHVDISGFIGKYGHGDEPGHQMPYLYNYVNQPWKTQKYVNTVMRTMYSDRPDGMINNEDLGQMSAWYVFSALGFYPVSPASLEYQLGAPFQEEANIHLDNGKTFTVRAKNRTKENLYVQSATLNGEDYTKTYIHHKTIMDGGVLTFTMGPEPNKVWGAKDEDSSVGTIGPAKPEILVMASVAPYDTTESAFFTNEHQAVLQSNDPKATIYYTVDGSTPTVKSAEFTKPIVIKENTTLKAIAISDGLKPSKVYEKPVFKSIFPALKKGYPKYTMAYPDTPYGKGDGSFLFDERIGSSSYSDGKWTGIKNTIEVDLDLGEQVALKGISVGMLTDIASWIFPAKSIEVFGGNTTNKLQPIASKIIEPNTDYPKEVNRYSVPLSGRYRYLKVKVLPLAEGPDWHDAIGKKVWLFVDEIILY
ncbi:glycoside hydrolase family 92 protein [Maribacter sp. ANRC-HE7]|uniref:Glycoside hydrolase family 92 protein n=1 Tax=Maribacter aquimaris TaxID=2737171 RepID=A0ABR7UVD1_9FLAO|nr:GH92 family glycosyl hydrolase [Maribacter aquimaris]MBD0776384.1 glycoside hydrolase family 92 protein [Maribacter aquimaris]